MTKEYIYMFVSWSSMLGMMVNCNK